MSCVHGSLSEVRIKKIKSAAYKTQNVYCTVVLSRHRGNGVPGGVEVEKCIFEFDSVEKSMGPRDFTLILTRLYAARGASFSCEFATRKWLDQIGRAFQVS